MNDILTRLICVIYIIILMLWILILTIGFTTIIIPIVCYVLTGKSYFEYLLLLGEDVCDMIDL